MDKPRDLLAVIMATQDRQGGMLTVENLLLILRLQARAVEDATRPVPGLLSDVLLPTVDIHAVHRGGRLGTATSPDFPLPYLGGWKPAPPTGADMRAARSQAYAGSPPPVPLHHRVARRLAAMAAVLRATGQAPRLILDAYLSKRAAPFGSCIDRVVRAHSPCRPRQTVVPPITMQDAVPPHAVAPRAVAPTSWAIQERRNPSSPVLEHARDRYDQRFARCRRAFATARAGHGRRRDRTLRYACDHRLSDHATIVASNGIPTALLAAGRITEACSMGWRGPIGGVRDPVMHYPLGFPPGARPSPADIRVIAVRLMLHLGADPRRQRWAVVVHTDKLASDGRIDAHLILGRVRDDNYAWHLPARWSYPACQLMGWMIAHEHGLGSDHRTDAMVRGGSYDAVLREAWATGREPGTHGRAIAARLLPMAPGLPPRSVPILSTEAMQRIAVGLGSATVSLDGAVVIAKHAPIADLAGLDAYLAKGAEVSIQAAGIH